MDRGAPPVDPRLLDAFRLAARARGALGAAGIGLELWEALRLAQSEGSYLTEEVRKVSSLRAAGKAARAGSMLQEAIDRVRRAHGRHARVLRPVLEALPAAPDAERLEVTLALAFATPDRRAALDRWAADPAPATGTLAALAEESGFLLAALRSPVLPEGVDPELFADLREADRLRRRLPSRPELSEILPLAIHDRAAVRRAAQDLAAPAPVDGLNAGLIRFLEGLLDFQECTGGLARDLRAYAATLPMGCYGPETFELALGLILASPEGLRRAEQWLEDPERCRVEAALRLEGVIGKAQNYERALRSLPAA